MKNIQVIDGAINCVYDIFSATADEFDLIFPVRHDVAFIDEVLAREDVQKVAAALENVWKRRLAKREAMGIHGILFYGLEGKKAYYPRRRDEDAVNPDGSKLR